MLTQSNYEFVNTDRLTPEIFEKIFEIEQDMWSRGIGEYLQCTDCENIYSKEGIYKNNFNLSKEVMIQTVMGIEKHLGFVPNCPCCYGTTKHVYNHDEYLPEIQARHENYESFLSIVKNKEGEITGFMDGYISTLQEIFENEFSFHFEENVLDELIEKYKIHRHTRMLTVSSIGTDDKNKSLLTTISLLKIFFNNIDEKHDSIPGMVESIIGSSTYCIFDLMGAEKFGIQKRSELILQGSINEKYKTDILFQNEVIAKYKTKFSIGVRDIVRHSRRLSLGEVFA